MNSVKAWWAVIAATLFCAVTVMAQPGMSGVLPTTDQQALDLGAWLWNAFVTKQYAAAFGPALTLIVWMLRKWDLKIPKIGPAIDKFLNIPFVAFLLPTVIASAAGFATALSQHQPWTAAIGAIFATASSAIVTYVGLNKAAESIVQGVDAAKAVQTKTQAISAIKALGSTPDDTPTTPNGSIPKP